MSATVSYQNIFSNQLTCVSGGELTAVEIIPWPKHLIRKTDKDSWISQDSFNQMSYLVMAPLRTYRTSVYMIPDHLFINIHNAFTNEIISGY